MIAQIKHEAQTESKPNLAALIFSLNDTNDQIQVSGSEVDVHTLQKNFVSKLRSGVDNVMTKVESRVRDAMLTAIKNLVIPRVEPGKKSVNAHRVGSVVMDPEQRDFSENVEGLQLTISSRINSHTDLNKMNETCGNISVEGGDLLIN